MESTFLRLKHRPKCFRRERHPVTHNIHMVYCDVDRRVQGALRLAGSGEWRNWQTR